MTNPTPTPEASSAGFTVTEVLVALSIMVIVTIPTLMVLQSASRADVRHTTTIQASNDGSVAVNRLSADIRSAEQIKIGNSSVLVLAGHDLSGQATEVVWERKDNQLLRTETDSSGKPETSYVLSDLSEAPKEPLFSAFSSSGQEVRTEEVICASYIAVDIERLDSDENIEHLVFDVASRNLSASGGAC